MIFTCVFGTPYMNKALKFAFLVAGFSLLLPGALNASIVSVQTPEAKVTGTVTYRERIALTPDAMVEIKLVDISRADAPAITIAEQIIENPGQVPISFEIEYNPDDIDERFVYAVEAKITEDGDLSFRNDTKYNVITRDSPTHVDMILVRVASTPTPSDPATPPSVGGIAPSGWLLSAMAVIGLILTLVGKRKLSEARLNR